MAESGLCMAGSRQSGADVRSANVTAVLALSNVLKTSLGPQGLDKMLVDDIGEVTITNDGATILKMLEVEHPASKVLVDLANLQDSEVGDGTTSVVIIAAELLKRSNDLVRRGVHPTLIMAGFRMAMREAVKYIPANLSVKSDSLSKDFLCNVARTSLSSKFISGGNFFANMVVDAVRSVKMTGADGKTKYPISQINIVKCHGRSSQESILVENGYAMQINRASRMMVARVENAKIALLDFDLKKHRMGTGVNIVIDDPAELEKVRQKEMDITKVKIEKIIEAGVNVVLTTKGIDDMALNYLVQAGIFGVRRINKKDMKRIAKTTGGKVMLTFSTMDGDEGVDLASLGMAAEVYEDTVGDNQFVFVKGCETSKATTILLRGPNEYMLDEAERSIHDSICVVSRTLESNSVVPGGGAVEVALSIHLNKFADNLPSKEQLAVVAFAEALQTIPKTLAINAACDSIDLLASLRWHHNAAQSDEEKKDFRWYGLDLTNGKVRNSIEAGVLEPMVSKLKSIKFATEAAITILRIDDIITFAPEPQQE